MPAFPTPPTVVLGLYTGSVQALAGGRASGIVKRAVEGPAMIAGHGMIGDMQADRRLHGGPDKALHHFPREHYGALAHAFPALAEQLVPGSIGENISTSGLSEDTICLGDIYALGHARVQVTQPRSPCNKIDRRYGMDGVARHLQQAGSCGWYYRVLQPGTACTGDVMRLLERVAEPISLALFHTTLVEPRPPRELLERLARLEILGAEWLKKLRGRLQWLARHT